MSIAVKLIAGSGVLIILLAGLAISGYPGVNTPVPDENLFAKVKLADNLFNFNLKIYASMIAITGSSYALVMSRKHSKK